MYAIELSQRAQKFLDCSDKHIRKRIIERLKKLGENPIPSDTKFIGRDDSGDRIFRYRVGEYRALYKVKGQQKIVLIVKIDKRPRVYQNQ